MVRMIQLTADVMVEKSTLAKAEVTLQNDAKNDTDLSVIRNH